MGVYHGTHFPCVFSVWSHLARGQVAVCCDMRYRDTGAAGFVGFFAEIRGQIAFIKYAVSPRVFMRIDKGSREQHKVGFVLNVELLSC